LWELKRAAGDPSYDRMRDEFGALASKSALSAAARGRHLPSWETTWEFVRVLAVGVLGQDETAARLEWRGCWEKAREPEPEVPEAGRRWGRVPGPGAGKAERRRAVVPESGAEETRRRRVLEPRPGSEEAADRRRTPLPEPAAEETGRRRVLGPESPQRRARESSSSRETGSPSSRRWAAYGLAAAVAGLLVVAVVLLFGGAFSAEPAATSPGDVSEFVADVTVPDGTPVPAGSRFVKTWELRNAGSVGWIGRYLVRSGSFGSPDQCRTPDRVPVPYTAPGEHVRISVDVQAPPSAGHCQVYWKMADSEGHLLLPDARAVFFSVRITA
jgi:hypothetical protein